VNTNHILSNSSESADISSNEALLLLAFPETDASEEIIPAPKFTGRLDQPINLRDPLLFPTDATEDSENTARPPKVSALQRSLSPWDRTTPVPFRIGHLAELNAALSGYFQRTGLESYAKPTKRSRMRLAQQTALAELAANPLAFHSATIAA
jgi:hypothetical protein